MICICIRLLIWRLWERMNRRFSIRLQNFVPSLPTMQTIWFSRKKSLSVEHSTLGAVLIYFIYRYFKRFYGGGVGGVIRPCPLFPWGRWKRCAGCCFRHMVILIRETVHWHSFPTIGQADFRICRIACWIHLDTWYGMSRFGSWVVRAVSRICLSVPSLQENMHILWLCIKYLLCP